MGVWESQVISVIPIFLSCYIRVAEMTLDASAMKNGDRVWISSKKFWQRRILQASS